MAGACRSRWPAGWRLGWTVASIVAVQAVVCALALLPVVLGWMQLYFWLPAGFVVRAVVVSVLVVPSYIAFAITLMVLSALATRATCVRTPADTEMRIADMSWPLLKWVQYMAAIRIVRIFAGPVFCGSPIWTAYLRLNGARLGRRVHVNTLFLSDHNLLEFGDDVVIGAEVHLSGHTVEAGLVKTARVRLGDDVTIGVGSIVDIGVHVGPHSQIGAMSLVPKHTRIPAGAVYAGIPVRRLDSPARVHPVDA
jgi:acetyltransferase-like isoleucine patch superfamily enzyme